MPEQKYIIRPVHLKQPYSLNNRTVNWWIFTMVPKKKKHSGPFYSKWDAQQELYQILNR
jgi:hypothetical protein